jgi:hypothetical protein
MRMVGAVIGAWAATFGALALGAAVFAIIDDPSGRYSSAMNAAGIVLAYGVIGVGAPMLLISAALGLITYHVLSRRGRERRLGWYALAGAIFGGIAIPLALELAVKDTRLTLISIPVGIVLGVANTTTFGAIVRRS